LASSGKAILTFGLILSGEEFAGIEICNQTAADAGDNPLHEIEASEK
jgi:hypothetical protein